jgi:hypothetical protein
VRLAPGWPGRNSTIQRIWTGKGDYRALQGYTDLEPWEQKWVDAYIAGTNVSTQKQWQGALKNASPLALLGHMTDAEAGDYLKNNGSTLKEDLFYYLTDRVNVHANKHLLPNALLTNGAPQKPLLPPNIKPASRDSFPLTNGHDFRQSTKPPGTAVRQQALSVEQASERFLLHQGNKMYLCMACGNISQETNMQNDHQVAWANLSKKLAELVVLLNRDATSAARMAADWGTTFNDFFTKNGSHYEPKACFASDYSNNMNNLLLICVGCNSLGAKKVQDAESWYKQQPLFGQSFIDFAMEGKPLDLLGAPSRGGGYGSAARDWGDGPAKASIKDLREVDSRSRENLTEIGRHQNESYDAGQAASGNPALAPAARSAKRKYEGALASQRHLSKAMHTSTAKPIEQEDFSAISDDEMSGKVFDRYAADGHKRRKKKDVANDPALAALRTVPLETIQNASTGAECELEERRAELRKQAEKFVFDSTRTNPLMEAYETPLFASYCALVTRTRKQLIKQAIECGKTGGPPVWPPAFWSHTAKGKMTQELKEAYEKGEGQKKPQYCAFM